MQYGIEVHTAHRVFLFRAADRVQQVGWIRAIHARIQLASENDLLSMAELMISDEEQARARRSERICMYMCMSQWLLYAPTHRPPHPIIHMQDAARPGGRVGGGGRR